MQPDTAPVPPAARTLVVLGSGQVLAWGSTYYLPAVLAQPIAHDTGWSLAVIVAGLSIGTLTSGLVAPAVGRRIDRTGGRPVLVASALLFAAGLCALALAPGLAAFLAGWFVLGLGMAAGLYDAAFGTLGKLHGQDARRHISALTLFGGFASTVCWPLSAWLVAEAGWRGACLAYAALHLLLLAPAYRWLLPRPPARAPLVAGADGPAPAPAPTGTGTAAAIDRRRFRLLATSGALTGAVGAVMSVHLLALLQGQGASLAAAVALGALIGPAQVGARLAEMALGRRFHPLWTLATAAALMVAGSALLAYGEPAVALALVLYGAGIGIHSIARGTVPLALFGAGQYGAVMGRLARPGAVVGALAPTAAALLWAARGDGALLQALVAATALNLLAVTGLLAGWRRGGGG